MKNILQKDTEELLAQPGYSLNKWPTDQYKITSIFADMELDIFPKISNQPAIVPTGIIFVVFLLKPAFFLAFLRMVVDILLIIGSGLI